MATHVAELSASAGRRIFGVSVLVALGALMLRMGLAGALDSWLDALVLLMGIGAWGAAWFMYRATLLRVILTSEGLHDSAGTRIAAFEDIVSVDRGTFAFKPSNGFLIRLRKSEPRLWQPGLYWRFGRRVGIGGITRAAEAKMMSDLLSVMLAERAAEDSEG